jgi:pyruvate dehydrogenase E2 component (dihydrolipoamide acetyltransferase)/4,5:9,10-diseco-3-hydroxy-5,9,17-trioxoandrosta-1(10),2-diene-4-oate hydrolase
MRRRWWRRVGAVLLIMTLLAAAAVIYGAYLYAPPEPGRSYHSAYLADAPWHYADTPVARFFYLHEGTGTPVVLISPGGSPTYAWHYQLTALAAAGHSVYVVDLPGQGQTVLHDPSFSWDLPAMTSALASFLDAVGLRRTALAGNSWSGGWALAFAQRYPKRVTRLVLIDSSGLNVPDNWTWRVFQIPVLGELLANFDVTQGSVHSFLDQAIYHTSLVTTQMVNEFWAPATYRVNRRATVLLERRLDWGQTQARLGSTATPTLILWGGQDRVLAPSQAGQLARALLHATAHVLPGCGHLLELDCPRQANQYLDGFLA